jgi:hypothetical protein
VYCSSSINALTSSVVHNEPAGWSSLSNMMPAPDTSVISAQTSHNFAAPPLPPGAARRASTRINRSSGIAHRA